MTKDYALAGLRLGYAVAAEPVISTLERVKPPWSVSSLAQKAGIHALAQDEYLKSCGDKIKKAREFLMSEMADLGFEVIPSSTNFFLVKVTDAAEFRKKLLKKGVLVRDATSFGLPQYIRLAPRRLPECRTLIGAIKEMGE
jgi:histidinol-phosphate aminotransferase